MNLYALAAAAICYSFCMCIFNGISIRRKLGYRQELFRTFLIPGLSALWMSGGAWLAYQGCYRALAALQPGAEAELNWGANLLCLLPAMAVAVTVYFAFVIKLGGIRGKELESLPGGRKLMKIAGKLHLL